MKKRRKRRSRRLRSQISSKVRLRDRAQKGLAMLPSLLTLGNLVCGFYAIVHAGAVQWNDGVPDPENAFQLAALAILGGMVFDMLDGRIARMTNSTSEFGAQLDSLADIVTFGVAPAVLVAMIHGSGRYDFTLPFWSKVAWVFGMAYACGTAVRLARFNVETASHEEDAHLWFKGLPSPAAAGVISTLVLLHYFLLSGRGESRLGWLRPDWIAQAGHSLLNLLPFVALLAGYLMVSRFRYVHFANYFLRGRKPFDYLVAVIFGGVVFALFPEVVLALVFCGFAASGPLLALRRWWSQPAQPTSSRVPSASEQRLAAADDPAQPPALQHPLSPLDSTSLPRADDSGDSGRRAPA